MLEPDSVPPLTDQIELLRDLVDRVPIPRGRSTARLFGHSLDSYRLQLTRPFEVERSDELGRREPVCEATIEVRARPEVQAGKVERGQ